MATSRMSNKELDDLLNNVILDEPNGRKSLKPTNDSNITVVDFGNKRGASSEEPAITAMKRGMKKKAVVANRAEERERVFSGDLGMKALAIRYLLNVVAAKRGVVSSRYCWGYVDELLTRYELTQLYDHFLPPEKRQEIKEREKTPPEYSDNDDTDEILNYLYLRPESHGRFLAGFRLLMEYRAKEFMRELRKKGRQSQLLNNLKLLRRQFRLSKNEMELVQFLHLRRRGVVRMGEVDSDNNGQQKIDVLAKGSGLSPKDLRAVLADNGKLVRHNIIDKNFFGNSDFDISWRFHDFLLEDSSVVPMDRLSGMGKREYARLQREEHRRVFSNDAYVKAWAARFFRNVMAVTRDPIDDRGWWSFIERVFTRQEVQAMYDRVLPSSVRRALAAGNGRTPPEYSNNDDPWEIMQYLDGQPTLRPHFMRELLTALDKRVAELDAFLKRRKAASLQRKLDEMRKLFDLTEFEYQAVLFLYMLNSHILDISSFREFSRTSNKLHVMSLALGVSDAVIYKIISPHCGLYRFGICDAELDLDSSFVNYLDGSSAIPLSERFFRKFRDEALPWEMHGKLAENEGGVIIEAIAAKGARRGMNVLLYGEAGTGKTSFAQSIAAKTGRELYMISMADSDGAYSTSFRFAAIEVAKKRLDPDKVILCIDECDSMLADTKPSKGGLGLLDDETPRSTGNSKGIINSLLDDSRFVIIWIANTLRRNIDLSCRRRFDYNVYFDALTDCARRFIWRNSLKRHGVNREVPETFLEMLSERFPVNAGGIDVAVRNAWDICRHNPQADFPGEITKFLRAHCDIMEVSEVSAQTRTVTNYGLDGLNIKCGLTLPRLIGACRNFLKHSHSLTAQTDSPRLNILLTGAPGTGKTEFVKYLAKQLDRKLTIASANEFLDKYVGETEHNIAKLFRDAAMDNTVLFIDEGDAMLCSRNYAVHTWEVTQVSTLLTQMENFNGIFVMATNFAEALDPASIRRFTYKLQFDCLDDYGKVVFYQRMFADKGLPGAQNWPTDPEAQERCDDPALKDLLAIDNLTPGDFRNARQQLYYADDGEALSDADVVAVLQAEVENKDQRKLSVSMDGRGNRHAGFRR